MIYYILHRYYEDSFNALIFVGFNVSDENLCIVCFHSINICISSITSSSSLVA